MPIFGPNISKTARVPITVIPAGLNCSVELWLTPNGTTKTSTSGKINFVSTGASQNVTIPIVTPTTPGQYDVYIDVYVDTYLIVGYIATDDVIVPSGTVGPPVWS